MRRRLFNIASLLSLLLCVASGALWARSLGHFELVQLRYRHWPRPDEVHSCYVGFSWYSNTLRLESIYQPLTPMYFREQSDEVLERTRAQRPPGLALAFLGEDATRMRNGYRPGFAAKNGLYGKIGRMWVLAVRPWLPTLLAAVLPAVWYYRYRKARSIRAWQFGLRELLVGVTALAIVLAAAIWLKN